MKSMPSAPASRTSWTWRVQSTSQASSSHKNAATLARFYHHARYTNNEGVTFHGAPIYDSVTVLNRSANTQAATDFVRLLVSPQGHQLALSDGFLDTPLLVGGDVSGVP
jgi:ABC-type molybdate transport system substrate-binding protein